MIRVSIIEDDRTTRESLVTYMTETPGLEITQVSVNAEDGLHAMRTTMIKPDVLVLDIGLPGMSGLEAIAPLKEAHPELDIIMFTTYEEEDKIFSALCAGATSYISKRTPLKTIVDSVITVANGGSYMSPRIARKVANHFKPKAKSSNHEKLTVRQMEITESVVDGLSYKMIAAKLHISVDTVRSHIKKIYKTLEINSKMELVKKYNQGDV